MNAKREILSFDDAGMFAAGSTNTGFTSSLRTGCWSARETGSMRPSSSPRRALRLV